MATIDGTPLLPNTTLPTSSSVRSQTLRRAARMIRRASTTRRGMTTPSMIVRETAAQEIEDRQVDWAYSPPVVALDAAWNSAFVFAALAALYLTRSLSPPRLPLRLWVSGYALQCVVHVVCVSVEFFRRRRRNRRLRNGDENEGEGLLERRHNDENDDDDYDYDDDDSSGTIRHLESANTMFSFIWWIIGFYWICAGGRALQQDSPTFYWLCVVFLVLDLFFVMFCLALASVIAAAVCCCLPCIIAILYVLADRGGASKEDIELLPKYTFRRIGNEEKINEETPAPCEGVMTECETSSPVERRLSAEDAECCICLSAYEDGIELRELPCGHHFHCGCVDKWLFINSTCPLCKYDISKRYSRDGEV